MKLKLFLLTIGIIFLLLGTNIASAGIWDGLLNLFSDEKTINDLTNDDVYKELILNDATTKNAIITLKNPMETTNIKRNDIKVNFVEKCGKVNNYNLLINSTCSAERIKEQIFGVKEVCYNISEVEKIYELNCSNSSVDEICYNKTFIKETIYENYTYDCFKEFEKIDAGDLRNIKLDADVSFANCKDGSFGYKIDWQFETTFDDGIDKIILNKLDWAWWNNTFTKKYLINCTNIDDNIPIVINGSDGFTIDGEKQIVWTSCFGTGMALYMHNSTDNTAYVVANDTHQLFFEVEFGNGTSYNHTQVWDANYRMVNTMKDTTTSIVTDSTSNGYTGTKTGVNNPIQVEGKIGKGQRFDGSDDKIDFGTNLFNADGQGTISAWISKDNNQAGMLFTAGGTTNEYLSFGQYTQLDKLSVLMRTPLEFSYGNQVLDNETWYNVVLTGNTTKWKMFVNGVEIAVIPTNGGNNGNWISDVGGTVRYVIGSGYDSSNSYRWFYDGIIDNLRYSNIERSPDFINQTYQNVIGTAGYGDLGAEESLTYIMGGIVKDSSNIIVNNAKIIIINQADNTITGTTNSNSTGGWVYSVGNTGTYLVVAYDPNNSTRDGDADPHIIVS